MEEAVKRKVKRRHLNAAECDELGRSAEGTDALTQPHTFNHRQTNPNRGLYPRTPTKRRRSASATGSPAGQQKGINAFFSVSGVLSSSPHKSSQPCTSSATNGLKGELFPKAKPDVFNQEEEEEDDDDDDDVSLLATPMAPELYPEEDELDDASLLSAELALEPETKQQEEVDHLEGITSEMFGDDDEFDRGDGDIHDEEEVEALPDAHYGLLGNSKVLQQPQGCIDDLPEEVLWQVLCQVPAQDLYRNVSLVCHRWRNIVQDTKFVPFKKKYYRYMMKERSTSLEICRLLKDSDITNPKLPQDSIRRLVVVMAQHKVGELVRPEAVLERVKKHRLFPHAEASIRLHIPSIEKSFNLGIESPNPYAAMAVILILSESVGDVQTLVSLLSGCMSETAIKEYLSHMAMMLLALKRNKIQISNRLHYNIYYVLHLMENGPFSVSCAQSGGPHFQLTREQQQVLSHDIQPDHVVKIMAFAGTGKTTTLVKYAEQRPHLRFLYVAFNKSVASEAQRRFPRNVDCKTVHSLAFCDVGRRYRHKLSFELKPFALSKVLPEGRGGFAKAKVVAMTLNAYLASTDPTITIDHVPSSRTTQSGKMDIICEKEKPFFVHDAQMIWNKMKDPKETKMDAYGMTHDGYLKLWQLQVPKPKLSDQYDVLFIDEAQDCTPAIMDVLLSQCCGRILVGDPHQQIYTFRGAVNALNIVDHTHIYYLTQSFRFGAEIAYVGATILEVCKLEEKILVGGKQKGGVCDETADSVIASMRTSDIGLHQRGKTAILTRCNFSVFSEAVRLTDANSRCRIHFVGGVGGIGLKRILDIWRLSQPSEDESGEPGRRRHFIRDPFLRSLAKNKHKIHPYLALKSYVTQTDDKELEAKLAIVEKYKNRIPELVRCLESCAEQDFNNADFIVGTVHKAKGLEFDTVVITDDFMKVPCSKHNLRYNPSFSFEKIPDDEWNLLYVAVTRAKTSVIITETIRHIVTMAGEYFLKSETRNSSQDIPCTVTDCPNCITPSSAFIMCKRRMKFNDGVRSGGPLCERCVWSRIGPTVFLMTEDVLSMAAIPRRFRAPDYHEVFLGLF